MSTKTVIYSGGNNLSAEELLRTTTADVSIWFPEVSMVNGREVPLNHAEQVRLLPRLKYKTIGTLSEIIILMFLHEIRRGGCGHTSWNSTVTAAGSVWTSTVV